MNTLRLFNHQVHTRVLLLGLLQGTVFFGSIYAAAYIRFGAHLAGLGESHLLLFLQALLFAAVVLLSMVAMGVYRPQRHESYFQVMLQVVASFGLAIAGLLIVFYVLPMLHLERGVTALAMVIAFAAALGTQLWDQRTAKRHSAPWRILIYGAGHQTASILSRLRRRSDQRFFSLSGCVPATGEAVMVDSSLLRNTGDSLMAYAKSHRIKEIVVAMDDRRNGLPSDELMACRMAGINVTDALTFYESQTGKVKTELLSPHWIIFSCGFRQTHLQNAVKRGLDFVFSLILLALFSPIMLLTATAILFEDGPRASVFSPSPGWGEMAGNFKYSSFAACAPMRRPKARRNGPKKTIHASPGAVSLSGSIASMNCRSF